MASVLIVCPFPDHHAIIQQLLEGKNWTVHHANSCSDAAGFLSANQPDAIICERVLPDGRWEDILRYTQEWSQKSSLIVSCRLADNHLWAEVLNAGGFDVLAQPFDDEELLRIVELAARSPAPPTES